ncbi:MAG: hypothetical protein ABDH23_02875 [Endomicrobiia bacterium]
MKNNIITFLLFMCFVSNSFSAIPFVTDDTGVIEVNKYELETVYENILDEIDNEQILSFGLKTGLTQKLDLLVSFPYKIYPHQEEKFEDASLGLKYLILEDLLAFSFNNTLGTRSYFLNLILTKELFVIFHLNIGYNISEDKNFAGDTFFGLAFEYDIKNFNVGFEFLFNNFSMESYLLGIRYKFFKSHFICLGIRQLLKNETQSNTTCIVAGIHNEF